MIEPVTVVDIQNWRWHYSSVPLHEMRGVDLFVLSCLTTIEDLMADRDSETRWAKHYQVTADALMDEVERLTGELDSYKSIIPKIRPA